MAPGRYDVSEGAVWPLWPLWSRRRRRLLFIAEGAGFAAVDEYGREPLFVDSNGGRVDLAWVLDAIRMRFPHLVFDFYQEYMDLSRTGEPQR